MAHAVRKSEYLALEESIRRQIYWDHVVQGWLWQLPGTVLRDPEEMPRADRREAPSPRALQDYGWLKEPESALSH